MGDARLRTHWKAGRISVFCLLPTLPLTSRDSTGRVTKGLLLEVADEVDVIEPVTKFVAPLQDVMGVRNVFNVGLEAWHPAEGTYYDLI